MFSEDFAQDAMRQTMWKAYLKKIKYKGVLPFGEVLGLIKDRLKGMMVEG